MDADQTSRHTEGGKATHVTVALVDDLMDRSRVRAALGDAVRFTRVAADAAGADVVVVDLALHAEAIPEIRRVAPTARIVAFGPHVDDAALTAARTAGADAVLPRSRFFHDVAAAVTPATGQ
jgi:DNA-binding NarL/FixJ family response regulator